jgi:hypothetical protein
MASPVNVWWSWDTISVNAELWMTPCCYLIRLIFDLVIYDISVQTMEMLHKTQGKYGISVFYYFVLGRVRNYCGIIIFPRWFNFRVFRALANQTLAKANPWIFRLIRIIQLREFMPSQKFHLCLFYAKFHPREIKWYTVCKLMLTIGCVVSLQSKNKSIGFASGFGNSTRRV